MKSKRGWGLANELLFLLVFVLCLIITFIYLYKAGLFKNDIIPIIDNKTTIITKKFDYEALESKLKESTEMYIEKEYNNNLGLDRLIIKSKVLIDKELLKDFNDENQELCKGYCEVFINDDGKIQYNPYIKCGNKYKTKGYEDRKDE